MHWSFTTLLFHLAKGRELIKLIKCTKLTPVKTMLEKILMVKLINSQS